MHSSIGTTTVLELPIRSRTNEKCRIVECTQFASRHLLEFFTLGTVSLLASALPFEVSGASEHIDVTRIL